MAEPSDSPERGSLADALRRYVDAVVGVTEVSRERAEKIIGDLARRGETRTKDIQKAAKELADRSARNQRDLARLVQKEIRRQIEGLGLATRDDVGRLQRRVKELEDGPAAGPKPEGSRARATVPPAGTKGASRKPTAKKPRARKPRPEKPAAGEQRPAPE